MVCSPATVDSVGNGVESQAGTMSSIVRPAGRNGSETVPVEIGITSEQLVSVLWLKPSRDILSIVCVNFSSMFARSAIKTRG